MGKEGKDIIKAGEKEGKEVRIFEDDGLDLSEAFSDFADFEPIRPFGNPVAMHSTDFLTSNLIDSPELLVEDAEMAENLQLMTGRFGNGLFKWGKYMDRIQKAKFLDVLEEEGVDEAVDWVDHNVSDPWENFGPD